MPQAMSIAKAVIDNIAALDLHKISEAAESAKLKIVEAEEKFDSCNDISSIELARVGQQYVDKNSTLSKIFN